ncbi:uncharacterized protein BCR38DRAFT_497350 [Pseudomassariella vexata]|uniref:Ubiquitin-like protease family profile domain-containing protein n=1 Tax=Pseudomassariella vexata TaxID=1141098 RepID=A0A1Y2DLC8_9PEZI|nr:uncharacterized protein BCR38DRAFT_497350 [Pseudomassariella vexata]ORY59936.1 hypothetical protein BCR38DRAFT_497350 [Pseudomassariella vexata]
MPSGKSKSPSANKEDQAVHSTIVSFHGQGALQTRKAIPNAPATNIPFRPNSLVAFSSPTPDFLKGKPGPVIIPRRRWTDVTLRGCWNAIQKQHNPAFIWLMSCRNVSPNKATGHWVGALVDLKTRTIHVVDSLVAGRQARSEALVAQYCEAWDKAELPEPAINDAYGWQLSDQKDGWSCGFRVLDWLHKFVCDPAAVKQLGQGNWESADDLRRRWAKQIAGWVGISISFNEDSDQSQRPSNPKPITQPSRPQRGQSLSAPRARQPIDNGREPAVLDTSDIARPPVGTQRRDSLIAGRWNTYVRWKDDTAVTVGGRPLPWFPNQWKGWDAYEAQLADNERAAKGASQSQVDKRAVTAVKRGRSPTLRSLGEGEFL